MENISRIMPFEGMLPWDQVSKKNKQKKNHKKKLYFKAARNFYALSQLVDDNHLNLLAKKSPLRLCVYKKEDDVFMDVISINNTKKNNKYYNRTITHEGVDKLIRQIHNSSGLVVDYSV
jgi:hypothetical protein